jgi:hypothetical protein
MRGAVWQTKAGIALGASTLLLSNFISRFDGAAQWAYIGLLATFIVVGASLSFYGWRQDRRALFARQAQERAEADIANPS